MEALDIFGAEGFYVSLLVSALGVALLAMLRTRRANPPGVGAVVAIAVCAGVLSAVGVESETVAFVVGVAGLIGAGIAVDRCAWTVPVSVCAYLPGAVLLGIAVGEHGEAWLSPFVVGAVPLLAACASALPRTRDLDAVAPALFLLAVAGIYVCVPETSGASPIVGAALPALVFSWPLLSGTLGTGTAACVGCAVWAAADGGAARPGAVMGATACIGVLWLAPIAASWLRASSSVRIRADRARITLLLVQCILVALCARVAGLLDSFWLSAVACAIASAVALWLLARVAPLPEAT